MFVPEYWNPPSLFGLAQRTGFDIESLVFAFAIGGIAAVLYERVVRVRHEPVSPAERASTRHRLHPLALAAGPIAFIVLLAAAEWNPISSAIAALLIGAAAAWLCRPDLGRKMLAGGLIFLLLYFAYFLSLVAAFPAFVREVWNLEALSGIFIAGIPLEELLFAFSFSLLWSGLYEHASWVRLVRRGDRIGT